MNVARYVAREDNGLRVLLLETQQRDLFVVEHGVLLGTLTFCEQKDDQIAVLHVLEHLIGSLVSDKYPDVAQVDNCLARMGAHSNASVTDTRTWFRLQALRQFADELLDIFGHSITSPLLSHAMFDQEKPAVEHETQAKADDVWTHFHEFILAQIFPHNAKSFTSAEELRATQNLDFERVIRFCKKAYWPSSSYLILAAHDARRLYERYLHPLLTHLAPMHDVVHFPVPLSPAGLQQRAACLSHDLNFQLPPSLEIVEAKMVLVLPVPLTTLAESEWERDQARIFEYVLEVLAGPLRLMKSLRTDTGLVYRIDFENDINVLEPTLSSVSLTTFTSQDQVEAVKSLILDDLQDVHQHGLTGAEMAQLQSNLAMELARKKLNAHPTRAVEDHVEMFIWENRLINVEERNERLTRNARELTDDICRRYLNPANWFVFVAGAFNSREARGFERFHRKGRPSD
jgi:predicted Zn-dependent peptidase